MKILHVLQSGHYSGAENVVIQIIKMMNTYENVQSIYACSKGSIEKVLNENNIEYFLYDKLNIKNVKNAIVKFQPDVIHAHDFQASVICSILSKNELLISHIHSNPDWFNKFNIKTIMYLLSSVKFNKILTVSTKILEDYKYGKFIENKTVNIGNPVNTDEIRNIAASENIDKQFDVIFIGRLEPVKNPVKFIELMCKVKEQITNLKAVMVGDGTMYNQCKDMIENNSMNENIELVGFQDNPYKYLRNSKLMCITSLNEGYSLVAVEAISLGKPVISFNVGELDSIVDNECGLVSNDNKKLIDEIVSLLTEERKLNKKSLSALEKSRKIDNFLEYKETLRKTYECND